MQLEELPLAYPLSLLGAEPGSNDLRKRIVMQPEGLPRAAPPLRMKMTYALTRCSTDQSTQTLATTRESGEEPIRAVDLG